MPHLTQVTRMGFMNAYLVDEDDGLTLVDTAMRAKKAILKEAEKLGKPIKRIALTHAHLDHIGSLDDLVAELGPVEVLIGTREAPFLHKDLTLTEEEAAKGKLKGGWPGAKTKPTRLLEPGDMVGSLKVVAAPGHTPGHIAFLDTRGNALICGDAFTTVAGVATSAKGPLRFPLAASATWSKEVEIATAVSLRALDPSLIAPGHGKIVHDPGAQIDHALAKLI
jgi:glyoxylase-like metal-dependent hydrolase (beta-lactamase superfamily II)